MEVVLLFFFTSYLFLAVLDLHCCMGFPLAVAREGYSLVVKIKQHFHILLIYFIHRKFIISFVRGKKKKKKKKPEDSESQKHSDNYSLVVMCRLLIVAASLLADLGLLGMQASVVAELWFLGSRAQAQQL